MSVASRLESLREAALFDIDKLDDDLLLDKDPRSVAERIAEHHYLELPRIQRAIITVPRAVRKGDPGEPGREHALVIRPATSVEMWVMIEGFATLALLAKDDDLDLGDAQLDAGNQCLVVLYLAEHPVAETANQYFQDGLDDAEARVSRLRAQVEAYNESLLQALTEELQAARGRAKARQTFAAALTLPQLSEPGGRG